MSEQEIPFEENATGPEMEYTSEEQEKSIFFPEYREQEKSIFFPEYRDNEKLIPRQRPRQGNIPLALVPVVFILAFLLFSYVAGYAFYARTTFSSGYQNGQFYDHSHFERHGFPQQQFDQPNQPVQPNQPNQQAQPGQPAPVLPGTTPRIMIRHSSG